MIVGNFGAITVIGAMGGAGIGIVIAVGAGMAIAEGITAAVGDQMRMSRAVIGAALPGSVRSGALWEGVMPRLVMLP